MMVLTFILLIIIVYLVFTTLYFIGLATAYFFTKTEKDDGETADSIHRFAILVPAHNEEMLVANICKSLADLQYPKDSYKVYVIADNCMDNTVEICREYPVNILIRKDDAKLGKGYAIDFGLKNVPLDSYDAVLIIDADNFVDGNLLVELNKLLNGGEQAIQCYNTVGNRDESWFTQLLYVSRTINNVLYHFSKYKLGLSSYLMGNGICFSTLLLKKRGWTAFSIGEDWEYYAQLLDDGIRIAFAAHAKVYHQESKSLDQATSQRLRWSSGRFYVAKKLGLRLLLKGLKRLDWLLIDGSLPLLLPNYSLLLNLSLITFLAVLVVDLPAGKHAMLAALSAVLAGQFVLLWLGMLLSGKVVKIIKALFFVPFFLLWKMAIDFISFTGIYRGRKWVRTKRHISN